MKKYEINEKFAVEFRNKEILGSNIEKWASDLDITLVSIDSPIGKYIFNSNGIIYLRMHGRTDWYYPNYSYDELFEIAKEILRKNPKETYIYFNNNHNMLDNARTTKEIFERII